MKQRTKEALLGAFILLVVLTAGIATRYAPQNASRSEEATTGRYIQNNHTQPAWEKLEIGMTKVEVEAVWGRRMNHTLKHNRTGTQERWYYRCHLNKCLILTFENGILIQWEG
jgi:hypothetical protein